MSAGPSPRRKGAGIEHELVELHRALGIYPERYPLSRGSRLAMPVIDAPPEDGEAA